MEFNKKKSFIILIAGRARSGKSALAKYLQNEYKKQNKKVIISPYTKYLKSYIEEITEQKITEENKPRDLLQQISSKIIKGELNNNNFFIRRQIEDIQIYSYFADIILIPDVRFPEEIEKIKKTFSNVVSIRIVRPNYTSDLTKEQQQDITEIALDNFHNYDYEINNSNEVNLETLAKKIIQQINERGDTNE